MTDTMTMRLPRLPAQERAYAGLRAPPTPSALPLPPTEWLGLATRLCIDSLTRAESKPVDEQELRKDLSASSSTEKVSHPKRAKGPRTRPAGASKTKVPRAKAGSGK